MVKDVMELKERIAQKRNQIEEAGPESGSHADLIEPPIEHDQQDPDAVILLVSSIVLKKQGRATFENLDELAADIKENGQIQPIVVKPINASKYQLIIGERRYRVIKELLKQKTILARLRHRDETPTDTRFFQLSENIQRDDYLPLELAAELADLKTETGFSDETIAQRIGKSRGYVSKFMRLGRAPDDIKRAIKEGVITAAEWFDHGKTLDMTTQGTDRQQAVQGRGRTPMVSITLDSAQSLALILQRLAESQSLSLIDANLKNKATKKQLQAILNSRATEILGAL
jgi:ParB family chromosome partitioning protein